MAELAQDYRASRNSFRLAGSARSSDDLQRAPPATHRRRRASGDGDVAMAVAFTANALCCFAVVGMTAYKRGWVTLAPSAVTPVGGMEGSAYLPEAAGLKVEGHRTSKWPLSGSMWLKTCSSSLVRTLAGR